MQTLVLLSLLPSCQLFNPNEAGTTKPIRQEQQQISRYETIEQCRQELKYVLVRILYLDQRSGLTRVPHDHFCSSAPDLSCTPARINYRDSSTYSILKITNNRRTCRGCVHMDKFRRNLLIIEAEKLNILQKELLLDEADVTSSRTAACHINCANKQHQKYITRHHWNQLVHTQKIKQVQLSTSTIRDAASDSNAHATMTNIRMNGKILGRQCHKR